MTRTPRERQANGRPARHAIRLRHAARATGVAVVFTLSAIAGFGTEPTAIRPSETADTFAPRPFAISYAVRQEIARAREERQVALAAAPAWRTVAPLAYSAQADEPAPVTDRFDAFVGDAVALAPGGAAVPVPIMRPGGTREPRP